MNLSHTFIGSTVLFFSLSSVGCTCPMAGGGDQAWQCQLRRELPRMGHRNFIVVADSAYPLQSAPGIKTLHVGGTQVDVLKQVLAMLAQEKHVRPIAWVDSEQAAVSEVDAPGIGECRADLNAVLTGFDRRQAPHMEIIERLNESARLFNVILLKTDEMLPYTSVFLELDCGYWNVDKEQRLRASIKATR